MNIVLQRMSIIRSLFLSWLITSNFSVILIVLCQFFTWIALDDVKSVPFQACTGPEGSRKLRFPDFVTTVQDGGKVVSLTHRLPLPPQEILLVLISVH